MIPFRPKEIQSQARDRLRDNGTQAWQLVLIHTGVIVLISLLSNGLHFYLDEQISSTGGLSGLGTRSMLQTLQTMLQYASTLFAPFWSAGFLTVSMIWAANGLPQSKDLLYGFRRFRSILSYELLLCLMCFFVIMGSGYLTGFLFSFTPFAAPLIELLEPVVNSGTMDLSVIPEDQLIAAYLPFLIMWILVMIIPLTRLLYTLRLSLYFLLDHPDMSAIRAMMTSSGAMRGRKFQMFKLDLSFWWYYLLESLLVIVCYLDMILPLFGISLPFSETFGYFLFLALYGILQIILHIWKKPEVATSYALAYHFITHPDHMDPPC